MSDDPTIRADGRIAFKSGLRLTLQRAFAKDWVAEGDRPARSYGRLAFVSALDGEGYGIPILPAEIVWIGLEAPDPPETLEISLRCSRDGELQIRNCPPDYAFKGILRGGRYSVIAAGDVLRLSIKSKVSGATVDVRLVACPAQDVFDKSALIRLGKLCRDQGFSGFRLP